MQRIGACVLGAFALAALCAPALAQSRRAPAPPPNPYSCDPSGYTVPAQTHAEYDCSGTVGRVGLGASPFHPEGPGNVTFR